MNIIVPPKITAMFTPLELAIHKARFIRRLEIIGRLNEKGAASNSAEKETNDKTDSTTSKS